MNALGNGRHKTGPQVRTSGGRHYISTEDFLTFPSTVRDKILPKYKTLLVTRFSQVWLVASVPKLDVGGGPKLHRCGG